MHHQPSKSHGEDYAAAEKARLGVWMFLLYGAIYATFVGINVIAPTAMEIRIIFGLNLATVYGFGLIVFALVLAVIYNGMCAKREAEAKRAAGENK